MPPSSPDNSTAMLAHLISRGKVTFFLGAGVNTGGEGSNPSTGIPSSAELAEKLRRDLGDPHSAAPDLMGVSHQVAIKWGWQHLYDELHNFFAQVSEPASTHRFMAELPSFLRERGAPAPMVITTNYDDMLERALTDVGELFDVLRYEARPDNRNIGAMIHHDPDGEEQWIGEPNTFIDLPAQERELVVKIHGSFVRSDADRDGYVISEDDYIDYMTRAPMESVLPVNVINRLKNTHVLFLGYGLRDWNLRGLIRKLWGSKSQPARTRWAVQRSPSDLDARYWLRYGVDIIDTDIDRFIQSLSDAVHADEASE